MSAGGWAEPQSLSLAPGGRNTAAAGRAALAGYPHRMVLFILRGAFLVLVTAVISLFVGEEFQQQSGFGFGPIAAIIGIVLAVAVAVIAADIAQRDKKLSSLSGVFLGLVAGLTVAYALSFVVDLVGVYTEPVATTPAPIVTEAEFQSLNSAAQIAVNDQFAQHQLELSRVQAYQNLLRGIKVIIGLVTCYLGISLVIQTKDDFRFVIPYVEFAKEIRGARPLLLDTSVIVDGRLLDVVETRLLQGGLLVPQFVLDELQQLADSADKTKRARGRRGLDVLQKLRASDAVDVDVDERDVEGPDVDHKLIERARELKARVMTNDLNLNKVAAVRDVEVVNLNDVARALRPVVLPGEPLRVTLDKAGESAGQAVGYLEDGTMVVVENAREHIGRPVQIFATSTLQTSAGRMVFAVLADPAGAGPADPAEASSGPPRPARRAPRGGGRNPRRGATS